MSALQIIKKDVDILLKSHDDFILISLPGETDFYFIQPQKNTPPNAQTSVVEIAPFDKDNSEEFILWPFSEAVLNPKFTFEANFSDIDLTTPREQYLKNAQQAIHDIQSNKLDKIVLSRILSVKHQTSLEALFLNLIRAQPENLNFLFNSTKSGSWMGSTPETLIRKDGNEFQIQSLAGTMSKSLYQSGHSWSSKEEKEHEIVNDFISKKLESLKLNYKKGITNTVFSGPIAHLSTLFSIQSNEDISYLAGHLHPNPALSTFPSSAIRLLSNYESHNRKYYCGYIGINDFLGQSQYSIILRSFEVFNNQINFYTGGGITADSEPEKEWDETELKANSILSLFQL